MRISRTYIRKRNGAGTLVPRRYSNRQMVLNRLPLYLPERGLEQARRFSPRPPRRGFLFLNPIIGTARLHPGFYCRGALRDLIPERRNPSKEGFRLSGGRTAKPAVAVSAPRSGRICRDHHRLLVARRRLGADQMRRTAVHEARPIIHPPRNRIHVLPFIPISNLPAPGTVVFRPSGMLRA